MPSRASTLFAAIIVAAGAAAPVALAQDGPGTQARRPAMESPSDPTNAALVYWRVWATEKPEQANKVRELFDSSKVIDPQGELAGILRENQAEISTLIRASRLPECDFGIEYSEGFLALMPHLAKFRASARLLAADAQLAFAEGRTDAGVERLATIYRMARQLTQERVMISSLVSAAVASLANTQVAANAESLSPDQKRAILSEIEKFSRNDAFGIRRALATEGAVTSQWITRTFTGPDAGERLAKGIAGDLEQSDSGDEIKALRVLDEDAIRTGAERCRAFYVAADEAWDSPDVIAKVEALHADVLAMKYGPVARAIAPSLSNIVNANRRNAGELEAAAAKLGAVR